MSMRFDLQNQLSVAQAFTGAATVSTNSYQLQGATSVDGTTFYQDPSIGRLMALLLMVTTAAGAGSTHTMDAIQATNSALTTGVVVLNTITVLAAALTVGAVFVVPIPQGSITQQFLGFRNTSTGGATTVTLDVYYVPQDEIPYFKAFPKVVDAAV